MKTDALLQELIEHVRTVLGTTLDAPVRMAPATAPGALWSVHATLGDGVQLTIGFDQAGAGELTRVISGQDEPSDELVKSSLRELCNQIVTAATTRGLAQGSAASEVEEPELVEWSTSDESVTVEVTCATFPGALIVAVSASGSGSSDGVDEPSVETSENQVQPVTAAERLDVLLDIDLPLVVRFGCTKLALKALSRLGPGSLIDLSRTPDDPVELMVGERIVARGEVVVVSGSYGIRVLEVVGNRDGGRVVEVR